MTQLVLNIQDPSILPLLKRVVSAFDGVSISTRKESKNGLNEALEDVRTGNVTHWNSVDALIDHINSIDA